MMYLAVPSFRNFGNFEDVPLLGCISFFVMVYYCYDQEVILQGGIKTLASGRFERIKAIIILSIR